MDRSPAPPDSSAPLERSALNRSLMRSDLLRLAESLGPLLHRRLPWALQRTISPASLSAQAADSLLGLLDAPDDELIPAIDALGLELGAWRYFRRADPDDLAATIAPIAERIL